MNQLQKCALINIIFALFDISLAHASNLIDEIEGVYVMLGKATYQRCEGCAWVPVKNATDCLVIKKLTNETAKIFMSTIQSRGHSCFIEEDYTFKLRDKQALFFKDSDMATEKSSDGIYVYKELNRIKFKVQPEKLQWTYMACGDLASIENISFNLSSKRVPWKSAKSTGAQQTLNLYKYCPAWNKP